MRTLTLLVAIALTPVTAAAQAGTEFTRADTLRGSNTHERAWWDAEFHDLHVRVNPADSSIRGRNTIVYRALEPTAAAVRAAGAVMQIDLQQPLVVDSMVQGGERLQYRRDGNAFFVTIPQAPRAGDTASVTVYYHGSYRHPGAAPGGGADRRRSGPFHWSTDSTGAPWIATSNEGPGASTWWPLKDLPADEPDSQRIAITVPDPMINVSNGRLRSTTENPDGTTTYEWFVANPINSYNVAINANASYVPIRGEYQGEQGPLTIEFWALSPHRAKAEALMPQVKTVLACQESWFGPYPWYADGYKLIEVPYLGMEHQSGIAYGNRYLPGYLGRDLSGTGEGLTWDYIIVHETAHEWWGNNISAADHADMWIHEAFGTYAEALHLECTKDRAAGERYLVGMRKMIQNTEPIIGAYGVHHVPRSQDRYPKGANMLMTVRAVVNDDAKWRATLRGLNEEFRHQTVTGDEIRDYMTAATGVGLSKIFEQYLETIRVPVLEYRGDGDRLAYRWTNVVPGFEMPVEVGAGNTSLRLNPTTHWQTTRSALGRTGELRALPAYYVIVQSVALAGE